MAEPHLDHPGEIHWFTGYGPATVLGVCPHSNCMHWGQSVIAHGPDLRRYELVQCDQMEGCATACRTWVDGQCCATTGWMNVDAVDEDLLRIMRTNAKAAP